MSINKYKKYEIWIQNEILQLMKEILFKKIPICKWVIHYDSLKLNNYYNNIFWKLTKLQFLLAWLCSLVLAKEKPNIVLVVADDLGYRNGLLFSFGSWAQIFIWQVIFRLEFTYTGNLPAVNYTSLRLAL